MPPKVDFKTVEAIGRSLQDVEVTTTWGSPAFARAPRELRRDRLPGVGDERRRPTLKYSLSRRSGEAAKAEYLTDSAMQDLSGRR